MFIPNLSILPGPQRQLWAELRHAPKAFVLYGGTALVLRLGHRQSEDFDFFYDQPFKPTSLRESIPYLKHAEMTQFQDNTVTAIVDRNGPVKLSFFGALGIKRVENPDVVEENGIQIASIAKVCLPSTSCPGSPSETQNMAVDWADGAGWWSEPSHGSISSGDCACATKNGRTFTRHSFPWGVL